MPYRRSGGSTPHKSPLSGERCVLVLVMRIGRPRVKSGLTGRNHPSGETQDHENNNRWLFRLGLDIMYLFSPSLHEHHELRWQAFPRFPEPISLYVLDFLSRFSCILQSKNPAPNSDLVNELESYDPYFKGWFDKIHIEIWADVEKRLGKKEVEKYKSGSPRCRSPFKQLLRFVRNTWAHITDLKVSKEILNLDPNSFYSYIDARFPIFMMIAYRVAYKFCRKEDWFEFFRRDDICSGILKEKREFLRTYAKKRLRSLFMMTQRRHTDSIQSGQIVLE